MTADGLHNVKTKEKVQEMAWVLFGILTANAFKSSKRWALEKSPLKKTFKLGDIFLSQYRKDEPVTPKLKFL